MEATPNPLSAFLAETKASRRSRCKVCETPAVRQVIDEYYALLGKNDPSVTGVTMSFVHSNLITTKMGLSISKGTCYEHVRLCLKVDKKTGQPLAGGSE